MGIKWAVYLLAWFTTKQCRRYWWYCGEF